MPSEYTTPYLESIRPVLVSYANQRFASVAQRIKSAADKLVTDISIDAFGYASKHKVSPLHDLTYHFETDFSSNRDAEVFYGYIYGTRAYDYTWDEFLDYLDNTYGDYEHAEFVIEIECLYNDVGVYGGIPSENSSVGDIRVFPPIGNAFIDELFFHLVYNGVADIEDIAQLCTELIDSFAEFMHGTTIEHFKQVLRDY